MTITNAQKLVYDVLKIKFLPVLSQILGVSKKTIYRWINGDNKPSLDHYLQLQRILTMKKIRFNTGNEYLIHRSNVVVYIVSALLILVGVSIGIMFNKWIMQDTLIKCEGALNE